MPPTTLTLAEAEVRYLAYHRSHNHSAKTLEHYRETLADFRRFLAETGRPADLSALTAATLQAFHAWLVETPIRKTWRSSTRRSPHGVQGRMKDLRAFVRWLADEGLLDRPPKVAVPKVPQHLFPVFSDAELVALFSCRHLTARGDQGVRNRALVALLLDIGIRLGELVALEPRDVWLDDQLVKVTGKGDKSRLVPVSTGVAGHLREWLAIRGGEAGPLFWLTRDGVKMLLRRIRAETGLEIFPHKLRHTAATKLVRSDLDLHSVKRILGHAQLATVEAYLSLSNEDLKAKHAAASPFESIRSQLPSEQPKRPARRRLALG